MNLLFRLLWITLFSRFRSRLSILDPALTPFRCLPTDLDVLRHMNNGKYFSVMDLARVDLMSRAGLMPKLSKAGYYPVVVAETIRFQKSIKLFQPFFVESAVIGWDEKAFLVRQRFVYKDQFFAEAVMRARFLKKTGGSVTPAEILSLAGISSPSPELEPWISSWNQTQSHSK